VIYYLSRKLDNEGMYKSMKVVKIANKAAQGNKKAIIALKIRKDAKR